MAALVSDLDQKVSDFAVGIDQVQEALQIERERQVIENVALEGAPQVGIPMALATRETRCTPGRPFLAHATHPEARPRKVV